MGQPRIGPGTGATSRSIAAARTRALSASPGPVPPLRCRRVAERRPRPWPTYRGDPRCGSARTSAGSPPAPAPESSGMCRSGSYSEHMGTHLLRAGSPQSVRSSSLMSRSSASTSSSGSPTRIHVVHRAAAGRVRMARRGVTTALRRCGSAGRRCASPGCRARRAALHDARFQPVRRTWRVGRDDHLVGSEQPQLVLDRAECGARVAHLARGGYAFRSRPGERRGEALAPPRLAPCRRRTRGSGCARSGSGRRRGPLRHQRRARCRAARSSSPCSVRFAITSTRAPAAGSVRWASDAASRSGRQALRVFRRSLPDERADDGADQQRDADEPRSQSSWRRARRTRRR